MVDLLLLGWVVGWIVVGLLIAHEVNGLGHLSATVAKAGQAAVASGSALHSLSGVPFIGHGIGQTADKVVAAGQSAVANSVKTRGSVSSLSTLLGIAVAVIPSVPLLAVYLPLRIGRARERLVVAAALKEAGDDAELERFLARRALETLPYRRLRRLVRRPRLSLTPGDQAVLAAAELHRLGLRRRAPTSG